VLMSVKQPNRTHDLYSVSWVSKGLCAKMRSAGAGGRRGAVFPCVRGSSDRFRPSHVEFCLFLLADNL
jgi:hypothetical protein